MNCECPYHYDVFGCICEGCENEVSRSAKRPQKG